ncbi:uncharacterized protein PITG_17692 [Phytophthora infestans T30-4]|uniref:Uncharacterized protein n=1 Tax=Phytophthora infestans (strain T30-4) TaxID=403677 RepID=D0NWM5_PHYIT|nr:uncharacterized protein PITG_17692 [Phytophthora infestans T30-4]EEY67088.1 conserved hypothetical protein [Phytophthora infestans T30-4]|eukprot:XP_002896540.1 conserved hypothetical protein [Phytophthora infestans T30-4]
MLTVASPRSSSISQSQTSSQWMAPPAASWTCEEISMIQEMFLTDEKAIQIRDISISGGRLPITEDPLAVSVEQGADATSMLLSPIGADDAFLQQFMVDEKDAMAAFFLEAIDPFKNVPVGSDSTIQQHVVVAPSAVSGPIGGRPIEHVLAKLRAKVEGLNRLYYSRCMNVSDATESSINKVKLVLAIERLQRVIQGLSKENAQLKVDMTSCAQRSEMLLQNSNTQVNLEQLSQCIDESTCATAEGEGVNVALNYSVDGEVLKEHQDEPGWGYKSVMTQNGVFSYRLKKEYPKEVNMDEVMQKTSFHVSTSENISRIYYGSIKAQLVKKVGKKAVIMYDITKPRRDACGPPSLLCSFRVEMPNGFLLGARSINLYERKEDGGFSVTSCGLLSYPSRADIDFMAVEILCLHCRWENRVVGTHLTV